MKIYKFIQDGDWAVLIRAKNAAKAKYALWKLSLSFGCVWSFMECLSDFYYAGTISKEEAKALIDADDCDADFGIHQFERAGK